MTMDDTVNRWPAAKLLALVAVLAVSLSGTVSVAELAAQGPEWRAIQRFGELCESETDTVSATPLVEVGFAPVRQLRTSESPRYGTWERTYETEERRYPGNTYVLGSADDEIDLVSIFRRPRSDDDIPPYIWHVISVPSPRDDRVGFIARHREFRREEVWERREYVALRESEDDADDGTILVYVKDGLSESLLSRITTLWRATFRDAMQELVLDHYESDSRIYTHTFIYQDAPESAREINQEAGDRRNSSRRVLAAGTAFGFVLDHNGTCLAATTLNVVDRER